MAKFLILAGRVPISLGVLWMIGERIGLGRPPGDIVVERGNVRFSFPLASSLVLSLVISLFLWPFSR